MDSESKEKVAKLKELLQKAVDDIHELLCDRKNLDGIGQGCNLCSYIDNCTCCNRCDIIPELRTWRYADEAMKLIAKDGEQKKMKYSENILDREYSEKFDTERKHRVEVSYHKYGPAIDNFASGRVDAIGSLELCLEKFKKTKNTEYLLDVANYAMFRYMFPMPGEYFRPTDSTESAGTIGTPIKLEKGYY